MWRSYRSFQPSSQKVNSGAEWTWYNRKSLSLVPFPVRGNSSGTVKSWAGGGATVRRRIMIIKEIREMMATEFLIESWPNTRKITTVTETEIPCVGPQNCMTVEHGDTAKKHLPSSHLLELQSLPATHHLHVDKQTGKMRGRGRVTERWHCSWKHWNCTEARHHGRTDFVQKYLWLHGLL